MAGRIPDETLQAIRDRISIVEVISAHVSLRKAGRNHIGLCPFHAEKSPSFSVNEERGFFHCFGCGVGGSVFHFLMRMENLDFPAAVRLLARRAGVEIAEEAGASHSREQREKLAQLNAAVQKGFRAALESPAGEAARAYLTRRAISAEIVEQYAVGFCPPSGTGLVNRLRGRTEAVRAAVSLGLLGQKQEGGLYERLWGRITFPIRNTSGAIVGFGGRTIGDQQPKYLNSPESPLFHKGNVLYGLYEARPSIRASDRVVIVEGYLDVLALAQAGITDVVASLGTALTPNQLRLAKRHAANVVAFFDGDRAGKSAALRAFETSLEASVITLGAFLPEGLDPDDFVRKNGAGATKRLLETAAPLSEFFIAELSPAADAPFPQRVAAAERIGKALIGIRDPIEFGLVAQRAAHRLRLDEAVFREMRGSAHRRHAPADAPPVSASQVIRPEELMLLQVALVDRAAADTIARRRALTLIESDVVRHCLEKAIAAWREGTAPEAALDSLPAEMVAQFSAQLVAPATTSETERLQVVADCCRKIERRPIEARRRELKGQLAAAEQRGDRQAVLEYAAILDSLERGVATPQHGN